MNCNIWPDWRSQHPARLIKLQTRIAQKELASISITDIAEEVLHLPLGKNSALTLLASNPDMGPQSRPSALHATIKYAPSSEPLRNAVSSISGWFPTK